MKLPISLFGGGAICLAISIVALWSPVVFGHEQTRRAHEASLPQSEAKIVARVGSLRKVASNQLRAAETCQVTIRLLDAQTSQPVPGLETEMTRASVDLSGKTKTQVDLRAGKHEIGDAIPLSRPENVKVTGRASGRHDYKRLELVHNGQVIHSVTNRAVGGHFEAGFDFTLAVDKPGWIALRIPGGTFGSTGAVVVPPATPIRGSGDAKNEMGEPLFAHTSPIYVEFEGQRIFKKDAAEALIAEMDSALKAIPTKAKFADDNQRDKILKIYREGIETLRKRLSE
ncbi:MAG: hypothetical protein FJ403_04990 [Verrucomicrobia bacterium]|nr:hypothetical protein [Verrucomicrobiota bacterium]